MPCGAEPRDGAAVAITPAGVPAWIATFGGQDTLRTVAADGTMTVLDQGGAGELAAPQASDETFTWLAAGQPKATAAP
jgi:hypothetical protein